MSDKNLGGNGDPNGWGKEALLIGGLVILGGSFLCTAYEKGVDMSRQVLKRHDKDVRMLERKQRREAKEKLKEEKRKEKEELKKKQKRSKKKKNFWETLKGS